MLDTSRKPASRLRDIYHIHFAHYSQHMTLEQVFYDAKKTHTKSLSHSVQRNIYFPIRKCISSASARD